MKRVSTLQAATPRLGAYTANHPADASAPGAEGPDVWRRFRSGDPDAYKELLQTLLMRQQGLCAYCELRLSEPNVDLIPLSYQVEHVRPKSGAPGDALAWNNLMLCCLGGTNAGLERRGEVYFTSTARRTQNKNMSCGQAKENAPLPDTHDPRTFPHDLLLRVDLDGTLIADGSTCKAAGLNPDELQHTIDNLLNLNCERLKLHRSKLAANLTQNTIPFLEEALVDDHLTPTQRHEMFEMLIAGRLQPDAQGHLRAFWTTERTFLEPSATPWLQRNALPDGTITRPA